MVNKTILVSITGKSEKGINGYIADILSDTSDSIIAISAEEFDEQAMYRRFVDKGVKHLDTIMSSDEKFPIFEAIRQWAKERDIYDKGDPKTQFAKLIEEVGELAQGILKDNKPLTYDSIGDAVVVLTNLAYLCDTTIENCILLAYQEIKSRTGKMQNGTFVKD